MEESTARSYLKLAEPEKRSAQLPMVGYVRVSRVGDREDRLRSPEFQRREIELEASKRDLTLGWIIEDLDQSGGRDDRPGLLEAISLIESGQAGGIVVAKLDRFSRSVSQAAKLAERIRRAGGEIISYAEQLDWISPGGELNVNLLLSFGQYQRDVAKEGFAKSRAAAIARGVPVQPRLPPGLRKVRNEQGVVVGVEQDPEVAPVMLQFFKLAAEGVRVGELQAHLERAGVMTSMGAGSWSRQAVKNLIRNPLYRGRLQSGDYVNDDAMEPIVDEALWVAAQRARPTSATKPKTAEYPLTGFLRCYACRYAMEGTKDRFGARWYRCGGQHSAGRCPERARVKADAIEAYVYYQVIELAGDVLYRSEAKLDGDRILELERELADVRDAIQYLTADTPAMMKAIGKGRWTEQVTKLTEREETTLRMLGTARLQGVAELPLGTDPERVWDRWIESGDIDAMRTAMAKLIDVVVIKRRPQGGVPSVRIILGGFAPDDLPRRGYKRSPGLRRFEFDMPDGRQPQ